MIRYTIEITPPIRENEKYGLRLSKEYGNCEGCCTGADSKEEAIQTIKEYIKRWEEYDSILGRVPDKVTNDNLHFESFTDEITKGDIFGNINLGNWVQIAPKDNPKAEEEEDALTEEDYELIRMVKEPKEKQVNFNSNNADKKVEITVEYGTDTQGRKDFFVSDNRSEVGINTCIGGCHSSAFQGRKNKCGSFEEAEKEAIAWIKKDILEDGVKEENITIKFINATH